MNHDVQPGARPAPPIFKNCSSCGGTGREDLSGAYRGPNHPGAPMIRDCTTCGGSGSVRMEDEDGD